MLAFRLLLVTLNTNTCMSVESN